MRVGVATVYTAGVRGGAEYLSDGLCAALQRAGHCVHRVIFPFSYASISDAQRCMDIWESQDFTPYDGGAIDLMIGLKWPAYLVKHPRMTTWLLHQHRPAYDLFGTKFGFSMYDPEAAALRERIRATDMLAFGRMQNVFTISKRVSARLATAAGITSIPLYHPPDSAEKFHCEPAKPFVLVPSRLEGLKRQRLILQALPFCQSSVSVVIAGDGGDRDELERLTLESNLVDRVRFVGSVSRQHLVELYAHAAAVFFGPLDEDYGYVTLEAMLAAKPVITCSDSGGPLEFVVDNETGWVVAPEPRSIADALDKVAHAPFRAAQAGLAGRDHYHNLIPTWDSVVERLTKPPRIKTGVSGLARTKDPKTPLIASSEPFQCE
jgi:glycosyltransferase involved in cell wall biosynthesis